MDRRQFLSRSSLGAVGASSAVFAKTPARTLTMVTSWPAGFPGLGTSANRVAERIEAAGGGELKVKVFAAGERVGPFEVFDAVAAGEADLYHSADYYQQAKSPAYNFFTAIPFGMTATELAGWIVHGGGQELWDELSARFNIKPLLCTNTGPQMGGWFNREIRRVEDFEGLKIRMPGLGGTALQKLGAIPVNLAGGAIHGALKDGSLDAAEWVGPWNDLAAGMHEVAEHYYYPGFHEPGGSLALGVNLQVWRDLGDRLQALLQEVTSAEYIRSLTEFNVRNSAALTVLDKQHGIRPKMFSDDIMQSIAASVEEAVAGIADEDPLTRRVFDSFTDARTSAMRWAAIGEDAFVASRRKHYAR